jgi:hypothetical protein
MSKFITAGLIFLDIFLLNFSSLNAQNVNETEECNSAIANTKNQLENGRQLQVANSEMYQVSYSDRPENRPNGYLFAMEGAAVESVLSSPVFLNTLAEQVINSCNSVSLVTFGLNYSDYVVSLGLMPNGKVELFQCPADFEGHPYWRDFKWGESC